MSSPTKLLPFQPATMSTAQLAAVSYLARYSGHTHVLYAYQLREWFTWCEGNGLDPLIGIQRAHVELYIRRLGDRGLMHSTVVTMMHGVRGFFRFAHIDGLLAADPAVYARLPKVNRDETRTQGLDRLELIRFLQVAQTITVHHGALAYLIVDDTRLDGFVVFAPWWSDRRTRAWTRAKTSRSLRRDVSHVCQRATHYRRVRP